MSCFNLNASSLGLSELPAAFWLVSAVGTAENRRRLFPSGPWKRAEWDSASLRVLFLYYTRYSVHPLHVPSSEMNVYLMLKFQTFQIFLVVLSNETNQNSHSSTSSGKTISYRKDCTAQSPSRHPPFWDRGTSGPIMTLLYWRLDALSTGCPEADKSWSFFFLRVSFFLFWISAFNCCASLMLHVNSLRWLALSSDDRKFSLKPPTVSESLMSQESDWDALAPKLTFCPGKNEDYIQ